MVGTTGGKGGWNGMILTFIEARLYSSLENARTNTYKMQTTYPLKIQAIRSKGQQPRLYVSFPLALAAAIGLQPGDAVQWKLLDRRELHLVRLQAPSAQTRRRAAKSRPPAHS